MPWCRTTIHHALLEEAIVIDFVDSDMGPSAAAP